mmetsp:Transcript_5792/g.10875  ORF Transcript_5792/g.10875 Transcript_5792/m.10875 type:complete len:435 (+) Transcript_5792:96-1400(+)
MQGLGETGAQQSKDCSFAAGSLAGAPLRVSWFLVIFFIYQLIDAANNTYLPLWVRVAQITGNEFLLLLTVLCHEMGHGTMARRRGGSIAEVLLWPFGGICFTTRPQGRSAREKLVDDLYIVAAGPATHFPMAGAWVMLLASFAAACSHVVTSPAWKFLVPFSSAMSPCVLGGPGCFTTYSGYLCYEFLVQAVQINVMLFMFNVFFPMYPMDGAKLIVCSLQLFCGASAKCAAKVLVGTSVPLAVFFVGRSLMGIGNGGAGLQPGITMYMGFMCLSESYKIYRLLQEGRLYTHPLFELARSDTSRITDGNGARLNFSERDDEEAAVRAPQVQFSELRAFGGEGRTLGTGYQAPSSMPPSSKSQGAVELSGGLPQKTSAAPVPLSAEGSAVGGAGSSGGRSAWLEKVEKESASRSKTVRELEEERGLTSGAAGGLR